jgi:solute carrier family 25 carnitine/acylcarnitine transporter 20/29
VTGPFEFTKLSAQIEMLMQRSRMSSLDDPSHIRTYQSKGTLQSAKDIVKARGLMGLYSGFHWHFSMRGLGPS